MANSGITLVLDPDEPGQKAAEKNGRYLLDLFQDWGKPRYEQEPTSQALATVQRACDDLAEEIQAIEAAGGDSLARSEIRVILFEYMDELKREERPTLFSKCQTVDEYERALMIEQTPIAQPAKQIDYADIKRRVDIVDYISRNTDLKQRGKTFVGSCPLPGHEDSTASFYVYPETRSFYCFGCTRGGDVIEYAKIRGISARDIA